MDAGSKLKAFRRNKGFSQEGLAEASGISIRTIQRIEKGLSVGSAFTLSALAKALQIDPQELLGQESPDQPLSSENRDLLKVMNLSALCVLIIPLSNILIPGIIFWKNRHREAMNSYGRKILSFQILWTLFTILLMVTIPIVLLLLFKSLRSGSVPLAIPVYFISVILNVFIIIRISMTMERSSSIIETIPNIL